MHERASQTLNRPREPMPEAFFMLAPPALAATSLIERARTRLVAKPYGSLCIW